MHIPVETSPLYSSIKSPWGLELWGHVIPEWKRDTDGLEVMKPTAQTHLYFGVFKRDSNPRARIRIYLEFRLSQE